MLFQRSKRHNFLIKSRFPPLKGLCIKNAYGISLFRSLQLNFGVNLWKLFGKKVDGQRFYWLSIPYGKRIKNKNILSIDL